MTSTLQTLNKDESQRLLNALLTPRLTNQLNRNTPRNYCIALLMLDAGLRVGEVVNLIIQDLCYAGSPVGAITLSSEKKKKPTQRTIPVTIRLHDAIETMALTWWAARGTPLHIKAFYSLPSGHSLSTRQIQRIIGTASLTSIGKWIHPHVLRHTFATRLMTKCPIRVVQQLLGHASMSSTQIYQHPNSQDLQNAIDALNGPEKKSNGT